LQIFDARNRFYGWIRSSNSNKDKRIRYKKYYMTFVLWFTGLPCSGKTTIARKLSEHIFNLAILDGDELREWLSSKDFSQQGRNEHNRKVSILAKLLLQHHVPVCVSLVSPYIVNRKTARDIIGDNKFVEIFVKCSLDECERRDTKGMYKKARNNEIKNFTGITDKYEEPINPDIIIDTEKSPIDNSVQIILDYLNENKIIKT